MRGFAHIGPTTPTENGQAPPGRRSSTRAGRCGSGSRSWSRQAGQPLCRRETGRLRRRGTSGRASGRSASRMAGRPCCALYLSHCHGLSRGRTWRRLPHRMPDRRSLREDYRRMVKASSRGSTCSTLTSSSSWVRPGMTTSVTAVPGRLSSYMRTRPDRSLSSCRSGRGRRGAHQEVSGERPPTAHAWCC